MASEEELGKSLNECPEENQRLTMYVDGVHVWGTAPEGAPEPDASDIGSKSVTWGDVDCNGTVDVTDVVLLSRWMVEDETAVVSEQGKHNADVKNDGIYDGEDTSRILKYLAKLIKYSVLGTK